MCIKQEGRHMIPRFFAIFYFIGTCVVLSKSSWTQLFLLQLNPLLQPLRAIVHQAGMMLIWTILEVQHNLIPAPTVRNTFLLPSLDTPLLCPLFLLWNPKMRELLRKPHCLRVQALRLQHLPPLIVFHVLREENHRLCRHVQLLPGRRQELSALLRRWERVEL